jgi:acyl-CoA synthetase (AMP-forming)/AMP-acid ligase II
VAVVSPSGAAAGVPDLDELRHHCRDRLAGYKLPRGLVVVDQIRRTAAGKPDHRWAVDTALAHQQGTVTG